MVGDAAEGLGPAAGGHAARVQPSVAGAELAQPVPTQDILGNVTSGKLVEQVRRAEENLKRRLADQQLVAQLAGSDFTGHAYDCFENELAAYGLSVLRGWMHSGYVFKLAASRGFQLHPSEWELEVLHRDSDQREELADSTVAAALPKFRDRALVAGGWRLEGGASIPTYFMGACLYDFPNEIRRWRVYRKKGHLAEYNEIVHASTDRGSVNDPAAIILSNAAVADLLARASDRERAIVIATIDGYTQKEIQELYGEQSVRAVEGVLHRWRTAEKQRLGKHGRRRSQRSTGDRRQPGKGGGTDG